MEDGGDEHLVRRRRGQIQVVAVEQADHVGIVWDGIEVVDAEHPVAVRKPRCAMRCGRLAHRTRGTGDLPLYDAGGEYRERVLCCGLELDRVVAGLLMQCNEPGMHII